jgi:hypothetical protein
LAFCAALSAAASEDAVVDAAVKRFKDEFYRMGAREDDRLAALQTFSAHRHEKVVRELAPVLTRSVLPARILAARSLGRFGSVPGTARELRAALRAAANQGKKTAPVRIEILRSLGAIKAVEAMPDVAAHFEDAEPWVAKAAIDAAGRLRRKEAVEPLLKAMRRLEGPDADGMVGLDPVGAELGEVSGAKMIEGAARVERKTTQRDFLREPIQAALREITREAHATPKAWDQWWSKAKGSFRVPE